MLFLPFYNIGVSVYFLLVKLFSLFNSKASEFIKGREQTFQKLQDFDATFKNRKQTIWFHCASLGEFEQAKPLIEIITKKFPDAKIAVSVFSPSAIKAVERYNKIDISFYLPMDSASNAKKLLDILKPDFVFYVKYELWYYFLIQAKSRKIKQYLISARFNKTGLISWMSKGFYKKMLSALNFIFAQDEASFQTLRNLGLQNIIQSGDTRIDRVIAIKEQDFNSGLFEKFKANHKLIIAGSSWQQEEELLNQFLSKNKNYKLILAPHEIKRSGQILSGFSAYKTCLLSEVNEDEIGLYQILIVDSIGLLSKLYRVANIAFVGGGFKNALHNIFEPAVYGIPVFFGNNVPKFAEAEWLSNVGIAFKVNDSRDFEQKLSQVDFNKAKQLSEVFFDENKNVTQKIIEKVFD